MADTDPECSQLKGCASPRGSFHPAKSFDFKQFKMGLVLGRSAPGLLIQRQAFQKILWSGSQADLARWLPSESITETPTTQPPRNKLIPDPAVWLDVGMNLDRTQILPAADKTSGFDS